MSLPGQLALSSTPVEPAGEHLIDDAHNLPFGVAMGDMDGDGDTDILATCGDGNEVAWWSNDGGAPIAWTEQVVDDAETISIEWSAALPAGAGIGFQTR
ncbi:MAG: hypothetical protein KBD56_03950 [Candidatus Eisenbacteria bacterium]|nr:hypothetical protein [Candidatus Eisenbacteria bacterium]